MSKYKKDIYSLFIRDPNQKNVDSQYIDNCIMSIESVFIPYMTQYIHQVPNAEEAYKLYRNMLKAQHRIIVGDNYKGFTKAPEMDRLPSHRLRDDIPIKLHKPILKKEWYTEELKNYDFKTGEKRQIAVQGIPQEAWHTIEDVGDGLKLYLPEIQHLEHYMRKMAGISMMIGASYPFSKGDACIREETEQVLNLLGWYIHLFVICHPFEKVNFSLCMAQVNYILIRMGHRGISHEYLDFKCFLNDTETVIKEFKRMVGWQ